MTRKPTKPLQPQIHDAAYKQLFSHRTIFRRLMALAAPLCSGALITTAWVKELSFATCETLDKSFLTDHDFYPVPGRRL
jgi:hypothetical protein